MPRNPGEVLQADQQNQGFSYADDHQNPRWASQSIYLNDWIVGGEPQNYLGWSHDFKLCVWTWFEVSR